MASNLLKTGAAWLAGQLKGHAADVVTYQRGAATNELRASVGQSMHDVADANGFLTRYESRDYLIDVADLRLDDLATEPKTGDRIVEGPLDDGVVYQVAPPPGKAPWEYADAYRNKFRVHTKFVGRQPPQPQ